MARTPAQEFIRGVQGEASGLDDQLADTLGGIMNQLPSLLMNYSLKEDALAKSIATKSAENILAKSSKFTKGKQYEDSITYIESLFSEHGDDLTMTAVRNNALEALNENMFNFNENESATVKLNSLLNDERSARTTLDTDAYREVIDDFTTIFNSKREFLSKQAINNYSKEKDHMLSWLDHATLTMGWDEDLKSPGLQTADKHIEMSGHALKLNDLKSAFKYLGDAGKGIAAGSEHAAYAGSVPKLRTLTDMYRSTRGRIKQAAYLQYTSEFKTPSQQDASDPTAMKLLGTQVENQLTRLFAKTGFHTLTDKDGNILASDSQKSIRGLIQHLQDKELWNDMNASSAELTDILDLPGFNIAGKELAQVENLWVQLHMYETYYQTGAIANMAAETSEKDFVADLEGFANTAAAISDSVDTQFSEIEDVSDVVPVGNDEFGTPIFQRRDTWDMDQIDKANPGASEQELLMQQHLDALVALENIPTDTTDTGFNTGQTVDSAATVLDMDTDEYIEDLVLDTTGKTIDENVAERQASQEMIYDPKQGKLVPLSEYNLGGGLTSLGNFLGGFVGDQGAQSAPIENPTLNDVVVNQALEEERNVLEPLSQGEMPPDSGFPMDLSGPERSYKTQNIMKQDSIFGKKDKHTYSEKLEKDKHFVKDFERFVPKDLLFLALESLKEDKMREGTTAPKAKQKQVANDLRALQSQLKYYRGAQKSRPKNDQTGEIIEELFDESLYYFGQDFESVEAMLTALMSK